MGAAFPTVPTEINLWRRVKDTPKAMHQWRIRGIFACCRLENP